jgi:hypothetical protein
MRAHVLGRSEGATDEIVAVLTAATDAALLAGEERIIDATLDAAEYQPPSVRRAVTHLVRLTQIFSRGDAG